MSNQMPIARRLATGSPILSPIDGSSLRWNSTFQIGVPFNIQVASDIYWQGQKDYYRYDELGVLKPPFPEMWLEWSTPSELNIGGRMVTNHQLSNRRWGASISARPQMSYREIDGLPTTLDDFGEENDNTFFVTLFLINDYDHIVNLNIVYAVTIDDDGSFVEEKYIQSNKITEEKRRNAREIGGTAIIPALMSLALINCKNVTTEESGQINLGRTGLEKRRKIPARKIKYHTIILPGGGTQSDGHGGHRATAIHRVRGHFKTFTAEKPLLGQHVGTYWWGWQVRGKAENGVVVSDYKVGAPK